MQYFFEILQCLLATHSTDIIAGNRNYDLLKVLEKQLLDIFTDHVQMVNMPAYISGSLIDNVYLKKTLMVEFSSNSTVESIYFSDHDAVKTAIEKDNVGFQTVP